jgi:hypothetical protein
MRRHLVWSVIAVLMVGMLSGCAVDRSVAGVEDILIDNYLEPLEKAGIGVTVENACRYPGDMTYPWHVSVALRLDAPVDRVARFLQDEGMVVRTDRNPMIVQQIFNNPDDGWNGGLEAKGEQSLLSLVFNNAERSGWSGTVGWSDTCPPPLGPTE